MNNDLEQFSEERLKEILNLAKAIQYGNGLFDVQEIIPILRIALAAKQAKPIGIYNQQLFNLQGSAVVLNIDKSVEAGFVSDDGEVSSTRGYLYTTPQPAHTEQDGWIKCSDNLPAETEDADGGATGYLVRYENDRVPNGGFNIGVINCVFLRTHWRGLYTHWMPLPAAPKPESE